MQQRAEVQPLDRLDANVSHITYTTNKTINPIAETFNPDFVQ